MVPTDIRLAIRRLQCEPGFTATAILTLAIGIGACTIMFTLLDTVLVRPMGISDPDRVVVMRPMQEDTAGEFAYDSYRTLKSAVRAFDDVAVRGETNWSPTVLLEPDTRVTTAQSAVSGEFFDVLGARPALGRTIRPDDDLPGAKPVVVLSAAFWSRYLGANPQVIGRSLMVIEEGELLPFEIIGVMPAEFFYPSGAGFWTPAAPLLARSPLAGSPEALANVLEDLGVFHAVARLKPGITLPESRADLARAWRSMDEAAGRSSPSRTIAAAPLLDHVFGAARQALPVLMGAVLLVLFAACANVAGLLVARGAARTHEVAVQAALGATHWRLARQLLAEAALLAVGGGVLGTSIAALGLGTVVALSPSAIPRLDEARLDARALVFAVAITMATTLVVGLAPAWQLRHRAILTRLQAASQAAVGSLVRARIQRALVVVQVAAALVLLVACSLTVRSFSRLAKLDLGYDPANVLTFGVSGLNGSRYPSVAARRAITTQLIDRLERLPAVHSAAAVLLRPFGAGEIGYSSGLLLEGQVNVPDTWTRNPAVNWEAVTPEYFETMGTRLIRGRAFTPADRDGAPLVAIVSANAAARLWPGQNPIGQRLADSFIIGTNDFQAPARWQTVVGVVATARYREIDTPWLDFYVPLAQATDVDPQHFVVRTVGDPQALTRTVATEIAVLDAGLALDEPTTMGEVIGQVRGPWRFNMLLFGAFGAVSIVLTAIGIFGLLAYTVAWRRREIGLRMALGAERGDVLRMIVQQGVVLVGIGLAVGVPIAFAVTRLMRSFLFEVSPTDPATFAAVCAGVLLVAGLASYVPARRAATVDPSILFRHE